MAWMFREQIEEGNGEMEMEYPFVRVDWTDACTIDDECGEEVLVRPIGCVTVGFLIREEKEFIVVGRDVFEDGHRKDLLAIPRGIIQKLTWLEMVKEEEIDEEYVTWLNT